MPHTVHPSVASKLDDGIESADVAGFTTVQSASKSRALQVFEALSSSVRLDVFRLLVQAGSNGRVAGEISTALSVPPTNLSFHLKALVQSGLLSVEQEGRYQRYRANIALMLETIAFLTANCCGDSPEECDELRRSLPALEPLLPPLVCSPEGGCNK